MGTNEITLASHPIIGVRDGVDDPGKLFATALPLRRRRSLRAEAWEEYHSGAPDSGESPDNWRTTLVLPVE